MLLKLRLPKEEYLHQAQFLKLDLSLLDIPNMPMQPARIVQVQI